MTEEKLKVKVNKKILIPFVIGFIATILLLIFIFNKPGSIDTLEEISYPHTVQTAYGLIEKDYDNKVELISLKNANTKENVAKIKLNTPRVNLVGAGYEKVAEIEFTAYEDFKQYLSNNHFELYDIRDKMKSIERQLDFKYFTTEKVEVEDYKDTCIDIISKEGNTTKKCTSEVIGTHLEEREVWKDISEYAFKSGEPVRIGIFTEVQVKDKVEWIPTIYGVEIKEWAVWQASLNTGLVSWWTLNESSGDVLDATGNGNILKNNGATTGVAGVVGTAYNFTGSNYVGNRTTLSTQSTDELTVNCWIKATSWADWTQPIAKMSSGAGGATFQLGFYSPAGSPYFGVNEVGGAGKYLDEDTALTVNKWYMVTMTYKKNDSTGLKAYVNGSSVGTPVATTSAGLDWVNTYNLTIGKRELAGGDHFVGSVDECGIWSRELTASEIVILYNEGRGCTYGLCDPSLTATLLSPSNNTNFTTTSVDFSANISDPDSLGIKNVSLLINGVINNTNTSTFEGIYNWTVAISDGDYNYTVIAYDDSNNSFTATNGTLFFSVNTAPDFVVNLPTNTSYASNTVSFDIISTQDLDYLIINYNGTNLTISESLGTFTWHDSLTIEDGFHHLLIYGRNEDTGVWGLWDDDLYFTVDATPPVIDVIFPNETIAFHEINTNLSLNWTVTDDNLDDCWYNWNGTNVTVTCGDEHANINITVGTNTNLTFYANDTLGNEASDSVSWAYLLFYNYETYDDEVLEGTSTTFTANLLTNGSVINLAYLNYDGTNYTGTITNHGSNNFTLSRTLTAPLVAADDTLDFYWFIYQGAFTTKLDTNTQDVVKFLIDNCTTNTVVLYNFTIRDEPSQTIINRTANDTQGKIDLQVYGFGTTTLIAQYNKSYNQTNPFAVCINSSLASGEQFNVYALIEYKATNYSTEFYNIQNATINSTLLNQNISLFDLHQTVTQAFKLIVKDSSFLAISDALVEVHRKYIDEGVYKIVELPKTDGKGETTASLVVNDVIYKFIIKKYGVTVATFDNVRAICQTPVVTTCSIDFNAYASSIDIPDFEEEEDFNFTIEYNKSSRTVRSVFAIPSGVPATIKLQVNKTDALGTYVCEDTLTSTSGTLSCVVPNTIGNSTVVAKIYRDGDLQAFGQIKLDQSPSDIYGGVLVALALFIMLTLLGAGMSDNPVFTVLFFMLGIILLFALNLVGGGGFIGASATILWLIIAIIIVIIKGGNRS